SSIEGAAYLYFGSGTGPATSPNISFDNPLGQAGSLFGFAVASAVPSSVRSHPS
ncbi:MAG: hypothetical protein JRH20_25770, partial [Deltaproteobacteria bacterium]|nr:hypothetical protein [Deltaproteobacteria bacterium]